MTMTETTATAADLLADDQSVWTSFRTTLAEREELREHAHAARISVSELVRRRALRQPPPKAAVPQINVQTYAELGRIGVNLNQQTEMAHKSGQIQMQPLVHVLTELNALLKQVRREVIAADQQPEAAE
jgi:hypothetical protein